MTALKHLFNLFLCVLATPVLSAVVTSGEHETFTRIVFPVESMDWTISQNHDRNHLAVNFSASEKNFDLTQIFDKIGRSHIRDVYSSNNAINIEMNCNCGYKAFKYRDSYLVIDISESYYSSVENSSLNPEKSGDGRNASLDDINLKKRNDLKAVIQEASNVSIFQLGATTSDSVLSFENSVGRESTVFNADRKSNTIRQKKSEIGEIISSAINEGRLEGEGIQSNILTDVLSTDSALEKKRDQPHTSNSDSNSDKQFVHFAESENKYGSSRCQEPIDMEKFNASSKKEIKNSKTLRYDVDLDMLHQTEVEETALNYIARGLGAEARKILSIGTKIRPSIIGLSYAVDGEIDPMKTFEGKMDCDTSVALWAIASSHLEKSQEINSSEVLMALEKLPKELKTHIGAVLAKKLIDINSEELALQVIQRTQRSNGNADEDLKILKKIAVQQLQVAEGMNKNFHPESFKSNEQTHNLISGLIVRNYRNQKSTSADILTLNSAFFSEFRGHHDRSNIFEAHIYALLQNHDFIAAINFWKKNYARNDSLNEKHLIDEILRQIVQKA